MERESTGTKYMGLIVGHRRENTKERNFDELWGNFFFFKFTHTEDMYLQ
jgi:ribosomal protein L13E